MDSDDINDAEFEYVNGGRVYALPRRRFASEFLFKAINEFGCKGGFTKPM